MAKTNIGMTSSVPSERVMQTILLVRGEKVMLDADLAKLYGVDTKVLLQAVKRNIERFPRDFMFQLSQQEFKILRSQFVTSSQWGGRRYPPYAFTEQGVAMLSSVLRSKRAIHVNIQFKVVFDAIRELMTPPEPKKKRSIGFAASEGKGKWSGSPPFCVSSRRKPQSWTPPSPPI